MIRTINNLELKKLFTKLKKKIEIIETLKSLKYFIIIKKSNILVIFTFLIFIKIRKSFISPGNLNKKKTRNF